MILELPQILSGITASPGQLLVSNNVFSGLTISLGRAIRPQIVPGITRLSGISICQGQVVQNISPKIVSNVFTLLFGANARQNANHLIIDKNDFLALIAKDNNTAESLLAALFSKNLSNFKTVYTPTVDFQYWGVGYIENWQIDTIIVTVYNLLPTTSVNEIADYNSNVNPMNY